MLNSQHARVVIFQHLVPVCFPSCVNLIIGVENLPMYKILGTDQKEYGPVSAEQLQQWIGEGRVHGQTATQTEGAADWKPLSTFAEFAGSLRADPPPVSPPPRAHSTTG